MSGPVARWLDTFVCKQYYEVFKMYGFDTLNQVSRLQSYLRDFNVLASMFELALMFLWDLGPFYCNLFFIKMLYSKKMRRTKS